MRPDENTVLNPYVVITPRHRISAFALWTSHPKYRIKSIFDCKPVFLKKENIHSAKIENSIWTFVVSNEDYTEMLFRAHKDEVQGAFEKHGTDPMKLHRLIPNYIFRSPVFLTLILLTIVVNVVFFPSDHLKSATFLNDYPLYQQYPKEFLSIIKTRIVFWTVMVPSSTLPLLMALLAMSGF